MSLYESAFQPILHLQIAQFSDEKTSIGLTIPNCFDVWGMKEILAAWSNILGGSLDKVPEIVDDTKILEKVEPEVAGDDDRPPAAGSLWTHYLSKRPAPTSSNEHPSEELEEDSRWIFMPAELLAQMTQECGDELNAAGKEGDEVSEGDVLLAWWAKVRTKHRHVMELSKDLFVR